MEEERILKNAEFNRFGLISVVILVIGCLGGLTVGLGAVQSTFAMILVVVPTMATLSMLLAVAPMKYVITGAAISVIIDILFLGFYLFV